MGHAAQKGIDRIAATDAQSVWHSPETIKAGILFDVPRTNPEQMHHEMVAVVFPIGFDNDVARTVQLVTVEGMPVADHVATVAPSGRVLGIVGVDYSQVSFGQITREWGLALARAGGVPSTLGTFNGGESFFSSTEVAEPWYVPGDHSLTRALFNIVASHTGETGIRGMYSANRVYCKNTSRMFGSSHDATTDAAERVRRAWVSIRHTSNATDRMREAAAWVTDGVARAQQEQLLLAEMAGKLVSKPQVERFLENYIAIPQDATGKVRTIREEQRAMFLRDAKNVADLGNHALTGAGITAYGLFQAVTHFEDWTARVHRTADTPVGTRRAFRAFLGEKETEKQTARDYIMAL